MADCQYRRFKPRKYVLIFYEFLVILPRDVFVRRSFSPIASLIRESRSDEYVINS
jgi:hypothetical protein